MFSFDLQGFLNAAFDGFLTLARYAQQLAIFFCLIAQMLGKVGYVRGVPSPESITNALHLRGALSSQLKAAVLFNKALNQ